MASHKQEENLERRENRHSYKSDNRYRLRHGNYHRNDMPRYDDRRYDRRRYEGYNRPSLPMRSNQMYRNERMVNTRNYNPRYNSSPRYSNYQRGGDGRFNYDGQRRRRFESERVPPVEAMNAEIKRYMAGEKIDISRRKK